MFKQICSIDESKFLVLIENLNQNAFGHRLDKDILHKYVGFAKNRLRVFRRIFRKFKEEEDIGFYVLNNLTFSILINADKSEAGIKSFVPRRNIELSQAIIDNYKTSLNTSSRWFVNELREKAYQEVINSEIELDHKIYSINLPTGLGKTFASLAFASKLREKVYKEKGYRPRIIYALPFLSIIDRNAREIEKIFAFNRIPLDTDIFLKHHHLSDIYYKSEENEFEPEESRLLIEEWKSEIIITTFVQLFHTLISNRNRDLTQIP